MKSKKQLCENIIRSVSKQLKETTDMYNQEIDVTNALNIKNGIIIEITNQYGKALTYNFKKFVPNLKNDTGIYLEQKRNKATFICTNYALASEIMNNILNEEVPDEQTLIRIYKKGASPVNDSVNEKKALTENFNEISGDFLTDFVQSRNNGDEQSNMSEETVIKHHIKYLENNGLNVTVKKGRFSIKLYIHYEGEDQFNALIRWCAWHFGFIENVNRPNSISPQAKKKIIEIINSGKHGTWV